MAFQVVWSLALSSSIMSFYWPKDTCWTLLAPILYLVGFAILVAEKLL